MMYNTRVSNAVAFIETNTIFPSVGSGMRIDSTKPYSGAEPNRSSRREIATKKHSLIATELASWENGNCLKKEDRRKYPSVQASALDCPVNASPIPWDHYEKAHNLLSIFEKGIMNYAFAGPSIGTSSTSSPSESCGGSTYTLSPASSQSDAAGYNCEGVHNLAKASRERCGATQHVDAFRPENPPVSSASSATTGNKPATDYIRRAQERIRNQQPTRRPRLQDLVDKQAEDLAAIISLSIYDPKPCDDSVSFSFDPHFPEKLTKDTDMILIKPRSWMMWSSGWDNVLGHSETEAAGWVVHAPRAVKPLEVSAARILELGVEGHSS